MLSVLHGVKFYSCRDTSDVYTLVLCFFACLVFAQFCLLPGLVSLLRVLLAILFSLKASVAPNVGGLMLVPSCFSLAIAADLSFVSVFFDSSVAL